MKNPSGFTLVEIIVVLAIVGILMSIGIPQLLLTLPNIRLRAAVRDLYSQMQFTKMSAIKQNRDWVIVFSQANNQCLVCSHKGADGSWAQSTDNTIVATLDLAAYGSGIGFGHGPATASVPGGPLPADDISYSNNVLTFNPRGTSTSGYVYLDNRDRLSAYAVGTLASGAVKILNWSGSGWK